MWWGHNQGLGYQSPWQRPQTQKIFRQVKRSIWECRWDGQHYETVVVAQMTQKSDLRSPSTCFSSKCRTTVSPCGTVNEVLLASIDWRLTWPWCPEISTIDRDDLSFNKLSLLLEEWERVFLRNLADALPKVCPDWATRLRLLLELELLVVEPR